MDQLDEKLPPEARDTLYLILAFAKESLPSRLANQPERQPESECL